MSNTLQGTGPEDTSVTDPETTETTDGTATGTATTDDGDSGGDSGMKPDNWAKP